MDSSRKHGVRYINLPPPLYVGFQSHHSLPMTTRFGRATLNEIFMIGAWDLNRFGTFSFLGAQRGGHRDIHTCSLPRLAYGDVLELMR